MNSVLVQQLAALARYPGDDYLAHLDTALFAAPDSKSLRAFAAAVASESITHLQEFYTRTFDLNPVCAPELGWHLFGETYERGAFLVRMRRELRKHDIAEGSELPDHLSYALELTTAMSSEQADFFVEACFAPAVRQMLRTIPEDNVYRPLLLAVRELLEEAFPEGCEAETPVTLNVLSEGAME